MTLVKIMTQFFFWQHVEVHQVPFPQEVRRALVVTGRAASTAALMLNVQHVLCYDTKIHHCWFSGLIHLTQFARTLCTQLGINIIILSDGLVCQGYFKDVFKTWWYTFLFIKTFVKQKATGHLLGPVYWRHLLIILVHSGP